jgi:hypothetical protein
MIFAGKFSNLPTLFHLLGNGVELLGIYTMILM